MNREQLKKHLKSYRAREAERQQIMGEIEKVEARMYDPRGPQLTGLPKAQGSNGDALAALADEHKALLERYQGQLARLTAAQDAIEAMIESLEDSTWRRLMRAHYIQGMDWDEVARAINYGLRRTHDFHGFALDALMEKYGG